MKILIVVVDGLECHLAYKLMNEYDVTIFDKNKHLFLETSNNNQNRLHMGYHYPRSFEN
jgi:L-2-hydroxyglutarate oxidase LhgO